MPGSIQRCVPNALPPEICLRLSRARASPAVEIQDQRQVFVALGGTWDIQTIRQLQPRRTLILACNEAIEEGTLIREDC